MSKRTTHAESESLTLSRIPRPSKPFHRSIRDEFGNLVRMLKFDPDVPQDLTAEDVEAVRRDIGVQLWVVEPDPKQPGRFIVDWDKTSAIHTDVHGKAPELPRVLPKLGHGEKKLTVRNPIKRIVDERRKELEAASPRENDDSQSRHRHDRYVRTTRLK